MLKDWLLHVFITFGLGLMLGLIFNSGNPLLSGLQAASAVAISTAIVARFKKHRFQKTSAHLRAQISRLQNQSHALQHNILTATAERTQIVTELDSYYQRRQAAEQHIGALETARQRMMAESQQLQGQLTSLQEERHSLQDSIAKIAMNRQQLLSNKPAPDPMLELTEAKQQLETVKQELQTAIDQLKSEEQHLTDRITQLHSDLQQLLTEQQQPAAALVDSRQELSELQTAIDQLKSEEQHLTDRIAQLHSDQQQLLIEQQEKQEQSSNFKHQQELEKQEISNLLAQLTAQKMKSISESRQLEADIAQLSTHKQSLQVELEHLHQRISVAQTLQHTTTTSESIDTPPIPATEPSTNQPITDVNWPERFEDEMIRSVFVQLQEYGSVTEAELTQMLAGNPRKARQFALKFEEYLELVPFKARVEIAASGKRYVRE